MNIHIYGDHSDWHCGSRAVIDYIKYLILKDGHTISSYGEAECVLINGEGALHDNRVKKIKFGVKAKKDGKEVHLVNAVWQNMEVPAASQISLFDTVSVREIISYNEIKKFRPDAKIFFDFSYFLPVNLPKCTYSNNINGGFYFEIPTKISKALELKNIKNIKTVNIKKFKTWEDYLKGLSSGKMLYTGYHHAVIAACKLRIPFIAHRGNTDKVLGIIKMAGADIPVSETLEEFTYNIKNGPTISEYNKLFDYMEIQKPFLLTDIGIKPVL